MTALFSTLGRLLVTLGMVAAALIVGLGLWDYYMDAPWTRDGRVRADVVAVAPDVSGLVTEVLVEDNQVVRKGDVLFRIDPDRFRLGLRQAEAMVQNRKATAEQNAADYARYSRLSGSTSTLQGGPGSSRSRPTGSSPLRMTWKRQRPARRATYAGTGPSTSTRRRSSTDRSRSVSARRWAIRSPSPASSWAAVSFTSRPYGGDPKRFRRSSSASMNGPGRASATATIAGCSGR